jgi:hypothetical protein
MCALLTPRGARRLRWPSSRDSTLCCRRRCDVCCVLCTCGECTRALCCLVSTVYVFMSRPPPPDPTHPVIIRQAARCSAHSQSAVRAGTCVRMREHIHPDHVYARIAPRRPRTVRWHVPSRPDVHRGGQRAPGAARQSAAARQAHQGGEARFYFWNTCIVSWLYVHALQRF